ncbi:MAG: YidC/Oxa1 family membrane protein insertase [Candidatus Daviesbacteria bacterium]|nr:YidC/Oxa1 family membrane protein insertase [Candidatus Daviesbacteria bacterium]
MNIGDIFNLIFFGPIINILVLIFQGLSAIHVPGALGFSILILTILIRLLVWPFMSSQIKATKKMADLKPHLDELKQKHKDDKKAFAEAQMALYKEHGVNPAGGCLPALIQIPVFIALYQAIINILPGAGGQIDKINSLLYFPQLKLPAALDPNFLGLNLGVKPSEFGSQGIFLLLIPVATAGLTFIQSKMTLPKPIKSYPSDSPKESKEKEGLEESMGQVQSQMVYLMPIMIGYFAFSFPVGLAIYWNTYTILGIIQQYKISGWGGMSRK